MFDIDSQERQAHHHFVALTPEQQKEVQNPQLFGNAAAFHAAAAFTDHVEKNGQPESDAEAQNLIQGYAKDFVDTQIDTKGLKLEKEQALKMTATIVQDRFYNTTPTNWTLKYATPSKAFDDWASPDKKDTYNNNGCGTINVHNRR